MNLDRLEMFLAIVDAGSMAAAARVIHLTQPALSHALKALEADLGALLFERRGRSLVLTPAGRALTPHARSTLAGLRTLARDVERSARVGYFDLRIGTIDSVATYLLAPLIVELETVFPELAVQLYTGRSPDLVRRTAEGELDVAIVVSSGPPQSEHAQRLAPYVLQFHGRRDRFPALARARSEAEVRRFPIAEIEQLAGQPTMIGTAARSFGVAGSLASVKALVLAGFAVGALLDFMLTPAERRRLVRARVPRDPDCALYLVHAPARTGPAERRLHTTLASGLGRMLAPVTRRGR